MTMIIQMVKIAQLIRHEPSSSTALAVNTSSQDKIHKIDGLERFGNLRSLNLANNMITKIENISMLTHLKIINLDFNQISHIENIRQLKQLEELSLSYNCLQKVSQDIKYNHQLRVIHLAYNDIKSLQDIRSLSLLPSLSVLSLAGNQFLAALSYISFIKLIIPSLLMLDSRDVNQLQMGSCVHPHEQIFILRDALNKLIDERNSLAINQEPSQLEEHSQIHEIERLPVKEQIIMHKHSFGKPPPQNDRQKLSRIFEEWLESGKCKLQVKKVEINELSEIYATKVRTSYNSQLEIQQQQLSEKIRKYREKDQKGKLSSAKKDILHKLEEQYHEQSIFEDNKREESRSILENLKQKQSQYSKIKDKNTILKSMIGRINGQIGQNPHKLLINQLLLGETNFNVNYRLIKKYLFYPKGISQVITTLNYIIFGENADYDRIVRLKQFLEDKSLIQIINNLKEIGLKHQKQKKKYERQKNKLISKIELEAEELCDQWKQLERQKWMLRHSKNIQDSHPFSVESQQKWSKIQAQERSKIELLKKEKEQHEERIDQLKASHAQLQVQFQRKYKELQQFEKFFVDFKKDKEHATSLKEEKEQLESQIQRKKDLLFQIESNIKELSSKEQIIQEKANHYERRIFQKAQQLKLIEEKLRSATQKIRRVNDEVNIKSYQLVRYEQQYRKMIEDSREYQKKIERHKSSLQLYEEKLRNLSQIQTNKKNTIRSIEHEIQSEKQRLDQILQRSGQVEEKLNQNMQASYQYQLKIQEGKKSIESLSDINRTLSDMLERQTQLKKTNLQLQLENQHLMEMKGKLLQKIKVKYDDQDQTL